MVIGGAPTANRHTQYIDSDSDNDTTTILTLAKASDLCQKPYRLIARNQNITSLADLSSLKALDYIDLTSNLLTTLDGIDHPRLKTLIVAKNNLVHIKPVYKSSAIRILNVSENNIPALDWLPNADFSSHLITLVASSNRIHSLAGLGALSSLQTLVISNNEIEDLTPITSLTSLLKLSASRNRIRTLPSLASLKHITELRIAHNRISKLPDCRVATLKILDMGHNRLTNIDSLATFAPGLVQVNLRENVVSGRSDFHEFVKNLCGGLEVIDGQRITGGRRKVRVNRIRKAVGFEIEQDRNFARMPSNYYLQGLKEKGPVEGNVNKDEVKCDSMKESDEKKSRKRKQSDNGDDDEEEDMVDGDKFVETAISTSQNGQRWSSVTVKVHDKKSRQKEEGKESKRKRREENHGFDRAERIGSGGASQW